MKYHFARASDRENLVALARDRKSVLKEANASESVFWWRCSCLSRRFWRLSVLSLYAGDSVYNIPFATKSVINNCGYNSVQVFVIEETESEKAHKHLSCQSAFVQFASVHFSSQRIRSRNV